MNKFSLGMGVDPLYFGNVPLTVNKPMQLNFGLPGITTSPESFTYADTNQAGPAMAMSKSSIAQAQGNGPGVMSSFNSWLKDNGVIGSTDTKTGIRTDGWGGLALSTGAGLFNAYMGMKQYGLFKDQLNFQKESFARNYDAQRTSMNTQLEDRQKARIAANPGAYQSVGEYMDKNRIK